MIETSAIYIPKNSHLEAVADLNPATAFFVMDYRAFTNDSITMMYEGVRGALASDDAEKAAGDQPRFRVRETHEWKEHAGSLEAEMLKRGMSFEIIDWSDDQGHLPL